MKSFDKTAGNFLRVAAALLALTALSGCATAYLDTQVPELAASQKVKVANAQPVQLLFEFQTKGIDNGTATDQLKQDVWDAVQGSGLFSQVSADHVASGALLHITINNVPLSDDAFAKGFMTGFTLGLVGSTVGDGYVCSTEYQAGPNAPKIVKNLRDAIYTSMGATAGTPDHADKMPDLKTAAQTMTRRVVAGMLNDVAKDPEFGK